MSEAQIQMYPPSLAALLLVGIGILLNNVVRYDQMVMLLPSNFVKVKPSKSSL